MTPKGMEVVRNALKEVYEKDKEVFRPLQEFYKVNVEGQISDDRYWK
jgi:hypothetical protein